MNNQQRQMQLMSYRLGLNTLSEALELAEKAQDTKKIAEILDRIDKLVEKNESLQDTVWIH